MGQFLIHLYSILLRPQEAMKSLADKTYWWQSACVLLMVSGLNTLSYANAWNLSSSELFLALFTGWGTVFLVWMFGAMMLSFTADFFGGKGRITDTMTGLGLACLPFLFLPVLSALPNVIGQFGFTIKVLLLLGLLFWVVALSVLSLQSSQKFSLDRSIGSLVMSGFVVLASSFGALMLVGLQFSLLLKQWG